MKQKAKNDDAAIGGFIGRLLADKKRAAIALCLVAVMAFMWVRLLGDKTPRAADGARTRNTIDGRSDSHTKVSFTELPKVEGRNDRLSRDFFEPDGWRQFARGGEAKDVGTREVNVVSKDGSEELVRRVAEKLALQAILLGKNPQAFINDRLLVVGDKLTIKEGVDAYEFEVVAIRENTVFMKCKEAEITLKIPEVIKAEN